MPQKSIYIIDDDPIYQLITRKLIEKTNLFGEIKAFGNGNEALNYFEKTADFPDVILLDIEMPVMDGWLFLDELLLLEKQFQKESTIYFTSSSIAIEDKMKAKRYPRVKDFLSKPINMEKLEAIALEE